MPSDAAGGFLRKYGATPVGVTPPQPNIPVDSETDETKKWRIHHEIEYRKGEWAAMPISEAPARGGEYPIRFIDGCQTSQPVLCLRSADGWPIPMLLSEVGAVTLRSKGRGFERVFAAVDRVLSFVADPFPWQEVEAFTADIGNRPEFQLRVLPANAPNLDQCSPFDYELMRSQAQARAQEEMTTFERLALAHDTHSPTLVDGSLDRVTGMPDAEGPLLVGVVKQQSANYFAGHDLGWRVLLGLKPGQRTPAFRIGLEGRLTVATWFLKLSGGSQLAPNWGYVRVEVPWNQFETQFHGDFGFVERLSRWLIDARCRSESYARMPVSLDPIVRAEESLKPLFTPLPVLVNRLYRTAGFFRGGEL